MKCCICNAERDDAMCVVISLTDEEKAAVDKWWQDFLEIAYQRFGQRPEEPVENPFATDLVYCRPCFRLLSNPEQGAQLMRGVFQHSLQKAGVQNAEAMGQRYYDFLTSHATKRNVR